MGKTEGGDGLMVLKIDFSKVEFGRVHWIDPSLVVVQLLVFSQCSILALITTCVIN